MYFKFTTLEIILASLIISFSATFFVLPYIQKFGEFFKMKDTLDSRKQKQSPLVRIGGLALIIGFFSSILIISFLKNFDLYTFSQQRIFLIIISSSILLFLLGFVDDIRSLSPFTRLLIQVAISIFIAESGINIQEINLAWLNINTIYLPHYLSTTLTTFWIVSLINAINWIDGVDGLASGIAGFAALGLTIISYQNGQLYVPVIAAGISGCSFGLMAKQIITA